MGNFVYKLAKELFSKGETLDGSRRVASVLNAAQSGRKYAGGRGTFNAIGSAYRQAHEAGKPDAWKILDAFRGKNGEHRWKK